METSDAARRADEAARISAATSPAERARWLHAAADALDSRHDELVPLAHEETHLPRGRLTGELRRTTFQLRLLADDAASGEPYQATIDRAEADWPSGPRPDLRRVGVPLGVVGVFGASNFPFAFSVAGGDTASALAAGCAVVHKVHSGHEQLGLRVAAVVRESIEAAGGPVDLLVPVTGREAGLDLVDDPRTRAIGFTGSTAGGRALFDRAMRRREPIPFYGELGSLNPVVVTEAAWNARRGEILDGYIASLTLGMGQFCTKPGLLLVPETAQYALAAELSERIRDTPRHALLTDGIAAGYHEAVADVAAATGVVTLAATEATGDQPGVTILATTAEAVLDDPTIAHREMFGPAGLVVLGATRALRGDLIRAFGGQLTGGLHAQPGEDVDDVVAALAGTAGRVLWNGWPTGVSVTFAQHHGGPYPASTAAATTSVGTAAIGRFLRPVAFQDVPDSLLPASLQDANPWGFRRRVDGVWGVA